MIEIFNGCVDLLVACTDWFERLLVATGFTEIYVGYVFVAMATGFLLKHFGSALSLGSDKAADHYRRKEK